MPSPTATRCAQSPFLRLTRCPPPGFARTLVSGHALHPIHHSSHPMQGTHPQALVPSLPSALRKFLQVKYGIAGNAADFLCSNLNTMLTDSPTSKAKLAALPTPTAPSR